MGAIFKARHLALNRIVAVKMIHQNRMDETQIRRFQQEAKAVSALDHPSIVRVHEFGISEGGQPHMVLDYIEGTTLESVLKEHGVLSIAEALPIFDQICDAISHAHERGVLHRDLKPGNIMLIERPNQPPLVKIVDFGIAKIADPTHEQGQSLTQTGEIFGSPLYMSPEQASGDKLDARSDIYSVGCVLFEALTGSPPFTGKTAIETLIMHSTQPPVSLKEGSLGKFFPLPVESLVAKSLSKDPQARFQSMKEFREALLPALSGVQPNSFGRSASNQERLERSKSIWWPFYVVGFLGAIVFAQHLVSSVDKRHLDQASTEVRQVQGKTSPPAVPDKQIKAANVKGKNDLDFDILLPPLPDDYAAIVNQKNQEEIKVSPQDDATMEAFEEVIPHTGSDGTSSWPTTVELHPTHITGEGLGHLTHLNLRNIDITEATRLQGKHLWKLIGKKTLRNVRIRQAPEVDDAGITFLSNITDLYNLEIVQCPSVDSLCLESIGPKLKNLNLLSFNGCTAFGPKLPINRGDFPKLRRLFLANTKVDDEAVKVISAALPSLFDLDVSSTAVSAKGIKYALSHSNLKQISIHNCQITEVEVNKLQKEFPHIAIRSSFEGSWKDILPGTASEKPSKQTGTIQP